ncbi:MAG: RNA polymerase factor sigma-54 [Clostridium sp.]
MKLDFNLNLSQEQRLVMTQQMQLSIKLLQMSSCDLREYIDNEFVENPMLEGNFDTVQGEANYEDKIDYKEMIKYLEFDSYGSQSHTSYDSDNDVSPFNFISEKQSLTEYLHEQVLECNEDEFLKTIVGYMIENLDGRGYLIFPLSDICNELCISEKLGLEALEILQDLEPDGIGAKDLKECLKIQLIKKGILDENLEEIIDNYLGSIADNKYMDIAKGLKITPKEAQDYGDLIKTLEPKPSRGFYTGDEVKFIIPDASIRKIDGEYFVIMNEGALPKLSISGLYKQIVNNQGDKQTEEYVKNKLNSAMFLIKSIEQRKGTLLRILEKVVEKQTEYFDKGDKYLKPMSLKEMAEELELHESTISRAVRDKYVLTNMGTIKIKDMFSTGLTSNETGGEDVAVVNIKKQIKSLVDGENKSKPLSDQVICDELNKNGINISRRTVAKYREELEIRSSSKRKRI